MTQTQPFTDDNTEGYTDEQLEELNARFAYARPGKDLTHQEHKTLCQLVQTNYDTHLLQRDHDDYEAAFQAAEHIAQERMRIGVHPTPLATPDVDGWPTWAFLPTGPGQVPDALRGKVARVEVQIDAQDADGRTPVHLVRGDIEDPEILETHEA